MSQIIDMDAERDQRAAVVREARAWVGTPYHHEGKIKGVGCDCAMLLLESFVGAGLVDPVEVGTYTHDWHMHRNEERYLAMVEQHCRRVDQSDDHLIDRLAKNPDFRVAPGDVLVWRIGRTFSHGAIVAKWPSIVHAYFPAAVVEEEEVQRIRDLCYRPMRVYSFWRNT